MEGVPVGVHVEHVDGEVVGGEVHGREDLSEGHLTTVGRLAHHLVGVCLHGLLDEAQQVLLVHAGRRVDVGVYLQEVGRCYR